MWFMEETDESAREGRKLWSQRTMRERKREEHSGECARKTFPKRHWIGK